MLYLSRKRGQSIVIGEGKGTIVLRVEKVFADRVELSFTAPPRVKIMRAELLPEIGSENREGKEVGCE